MTYSEIFNNLWNDYSDQNPSAKNIHDLFIKEGETVENDHIALRSFDDPRVNIDVLAKLFTNVGYELRGVYEFKQKKLRAKHYENPSVPNSPKVFISELKLNECSEGLQTIVKDILNKVDDTVFLSDDLIFKGPVWGIVSNAVYTKLREESEYAAWLYVFGFRANHFTVRVNSLKRFDTLEKVNKFITDNAFLLNTSGGEIKGSPEILLQQSSTMADLVNVEFNEGSYEIPSCYYEFALRYKDKNGILFSGFHADSADKIFESTDFYKNSKS